MITIPFILILSVLAIYKGNFIRKHNVKLYIGAIIFGIIVFALRNKVQITEPFNQGYLGLSFLYIVMMTGALRNKSNLRKKLMSVRREYSIIGFILVSPHALKYIVEFLQGVRSFEWLGVIPYAIMIPLFITSFMIVRKKFSFATWKKLQQFAYIVYILIFVHLIIVAKMPNLLVYIVLFVPYIVVKLKKEYLIFKSKK
ncbi:Sulfoxide reductase heme-binding subunit YedZ [Candidatus Izimaplasma bacterium HR1]|jgi:DMSO/TMAO reductase YedYZ heme-binding membrane subunit|uniref:ferric reductase-like transmembrane domain-containing protein n=1 Tax=Candidatus Izimoplasma sp. HR1 TaxID=1541959 RepID=UPI0004F86E29|nr:Sulfoxide reductase heme-binding subunit YedZ [Candidatus Izimaplasma bacterium HR1]